MITRDNLHEVIASMSDRDKRRVLNSRKSHVVLKLRVTNSSCVVHVTITNDEDRYRNVSYYGDCILTIDEVINILKSIKNGKSSRF